MANNDSTTSSESLAGSTATLVAAGYSDAASSPQLIKKPTAGIVLDHGILPPSNYSNLLRFPATRQHQQQSLARGILLVSVKDEISTNNNKAAKTNSIRAIRRPLQNLRLPWRSYGKRQSAVQTKKTLVHEKSSMKEKAKCFIIEFLQGSSIHGFVYLAKFGLNFVER